jgi:uncharacterized Zn finger protein
MQEVCYCGHVGSLEDRQPIVDERGRGALRCRECGHVDHLLWLSEDARSKVIEEAAGSHGERVPLAG